MVFFKIYLIGKTPFHLYIVYNGSETHCSSGFRGVMMVLVGVMMVICAEKAYFCRVVNKNYMATKKKEIIETKEAVQLPKVEKVRPDYAHLKVSPTYATTKYLADSFDYTKCYQLATAHFGQTPIWQEPEELWEAYAIYSAWCEATPVITQEAVKSGNMAGTLYEVPKKHLQSEGEFCMFLGASVNYLRNRRTTYAENLKEFDLTVCADFIEVIDRIREAIAQDLDQGATVGQFDANYVRALRGIKTQMDYTSNGEAIKGGLTVNVTDPKVRAKVSSIKNFKKDHKEDDK